ncbi:MAG: UDP-N-acetylglucosamine 2-epimerase (non-hydrolyzing) [Clostridia bacterium]|nr:UDP-N-acetylglucosamine 2-epimerase (non-hydrolyzing) [Clostridia bacterium]
MKIMTIVGTRPEIIKLSCVIKELDRYSDHILVHTGQNYDYELNEIFFSQLNIRKPDEFLNAAGKTASETIGNVIIKSDEVIRKYQPDAVLIYGDTNSCLSVISSKRNKVPTFHMEAGNRCFDQRVPEEINRKIVDHLSDVNLTLTDHARRYLINEGLPPETIIKIGSSMKEVLNEHENAINKSDVLARLHLKQNEYFVLSMHREENIDIKDNLEHLIGAVNSIEAHYKKPIIVSTHPRTQKKLDAESIRCNENIRWLKPLGFIDYIQLQKNAFCVISDSGTVTEEASLLKFPAITIRQAHERPEGMDEGTLIMTGLKKKNILESINVITKQHENSQSIKTVKDYQVDNVSKKVIRIIFSYTDYINRNVWKKQPECDG